MTFAINAISASSSTLTMSSSEIAELTGKRHDHVIRDIREMMEALEGEAPNWGDVFEGKDSRGYTACFSLPKDLTTTLISGYNVKMRHAITKRWMELEAATAPALPRTYAEALMAAAQAEMAKEERAFKEAKKLEAQAQEEAIAECPISEDEEVFSLEETAEKLGVSMDKLLEAMFEMGWIEPVTSD